MRRELLFLLKLLKSHKITAVPVKGPLMSSILSKDKLYCEPGSIHLILHRQDIPVVNNILGIEGYIKKRRSINFYVKKQIIVKIHSSLTDTAVVGKNETFRDRLEAVKIGPKECPSLSPVDHLLFICISGARECWKRIGLVSELSGFVQNNKELNWPLLLEEAKALQVERMVLSGLHLGSQLMDMPIPDVISKELRADKTIKKLIELSIKFLTDNSRIPTNKLIKFLYQICLRKGMKSKVIYSYYIFRTFLLQINWRKIRLMSGTKDLGPFVPNPSNIVERMLELAEVGTQDTLYDLGCGDGRIVIFAAKKYGIRAVGIEKDPDLIKKAKVNAQTERVDHLVSFVEQDVLTADFSSATIITSYLTSYGNKMLLPLFRKQLKPGTRIITRHYIIEGLIPQKSIVVRNGIGKVTYLHLWVF